MQSPHVVRGTLLLPDPTTHRFTVLEDGLLRWGDDGVLTEVGPTPDACDIPATRPGAVWMPGFVDAHIHFPQTRIVGSASGPLLEWLKTSVFAEEAKFADAAYAREVAEAFCSALVRHGTTCASIFSSSHPGATDILFDTMDRTGLRGDVGLTLMDRGAPDEVLCAREEAMAASEELVARWHGADRDRLRFRVTPRFALSCTPELLRAAGAFAARHQLPIQTHISENRAEIEATLDAFPDSKDYLGVYADHGLLTEQSLFAHGVWLSDTEWDDIADARAAIAHCPDSNFFLGSGAMPLKQAKARHIKLGLGTDIGAGRSFSLRRCCSRGFDASRITDSETDATELLWYATRGGAVAMGRGDQIGVLAPGYEADIVAMRPALPPQSVSDLCEQLVFREDHSGVEATYVRGEVLWVQEG